jgi:DNA-binding transcriptional MerR regulator
MSEQELYRIGTVSKLTGISPECLRAWERRYDLQPAQKTGRTRFYSHEQLQNLNIIKRLIEQGHPISSLAQLDASQLNARLTPVADANLPSGQAFASTFTSGGAYTPRLPNIGLIGANLLMLEQDDGTSDRVEVTQRWHNVAEFLNSRPSELNHLTAVALSTPTLNLGEIRDIRARMPDLRVVAVYQYAAEARIEAAEQQGAPLLAWPVTWDKLVATCAQPVELELGKTTPKRYDDSQLLAIASVAKQQGDSSARHLVSLITSLNAYEQYTAEQILEVPEDAELHCRVREDVSFARAQLEHSLGNIITTRAIHIPEKTDFTG